MASDSSWLYRRVMHANKVTPEGLALYRIATALFVLLLAGPAFSPYFEFASFAALPDAMYLPPPGIMQLIPGFPPEAFFHVLHVLIIVSWVAVLFGYRTRVASVLATAFMLVGFGFMYSVGKINHNILFVLLPLVMSFSNWGAAWSLDARMQRSTGDVQPWPIPLLMLLTGFAMFTAGFPKILGGWLNPATQAAQSRFIQGFFVNDRTDLLAETALSIQSDVFWEIFDLATVGFEVGFLFALLHPKTTRLFAAGAVFFHAGVMLIMNIAFPTNFIVYAAVLPWPRAAQALRSWRPSLGSVPVPALIAAAAVTAFLFTTVGSPLLWLDFGLTSDLQPVDVLVVGSGIACVLMVSASMAWRYARSDQPAHT